MYELHRNNVYQSVELLLLVPMLFLCRAYWIATGAKICICPSHRCPASCARSVQKFSGTKNQKINNNNNEKTKWGKSSLCHFSLTCTAVGFGCTTVLNMLEDAYP